MIDPYAQETKDFLAFHEGKVRESIIRQIEAMAKAEKNPHRAMVITQVKNHVRNSQ
jgi:hypothetical protein